MNLGFVKPRRLKSSLLDLMGSRWGRPLACGGLPGRLSNFTLHPTRRAGSPPQAKGLPHISLIKLISFTTVVFALAVVLAAQTKSAAPSQAETRAKKILDDAIQALGGDNFMKMEDRIEGGRAYSFYNQRLSGLSIAKIYTRYLAGTPTGKTDTELAVRERQAFGKDQDYGVLFTEDGGWEFTFRGNRPLEKERIDRYRDTTLRNFFYILKYRMKEPGMTFESRGTEVIENLPVDAVDITDAENRTVTVYFHQSTKLPVRQYWVWRDPQTKERHEEVTRFSRYRDVGGGVQWPHQILRERDGAKTYEMFADSVQINKDLTDNLFSLNEPGKKK